MAKKRTIASWIFIGIVAFVILVGVAFVAGNGIEAANAWFRARAEKAASDSAYEESERIRRETVLVIGVSSEDEPMGFSFVRLDEKTGEIYEIDVRPDIVLPLPNGTARILSDVYKENSMLAVSYLSNYLGIPSAHWVLTPRANYAAALQDQNPAALFSQITKTNFETKKEFLGFAAEFEDVPKASIDVDMLVSVPIECASTIYNEPHREQNAEFISARWGVDPEYLSPATQVSVLNGTETRGLGSVVAEELLFNGLQIAEIGNASNFDYAATTLNSIGVDGVSKYESDVAKIEKLLGVTQTATEKATLDADNEYDVVVCIGRDCTIKVPE